MRKAKTVERTGRWMKVAEIIVPAAWRRALRRVDGVVDHHRHAVEQPVLPGSDHLVAGGDAFLDLDEAACPAPGLDEDLVDHEPLRLRRGWRGCHRFARCGVGRRCRSRRCRRLHHIDVVAVEAGHHGGVRQRDRAVLDRQLDLDLNELSGGQPVLRVGDLGADGDETARGIDLGVDADDAAGKGELAVAQAEADRLADVKLAKPLLGNVEVGAEGLEVLERSDDGARSQVLPGLDAGDADRAAERRPKLLLPEKRLELLDLCRRSGGGRLRCFESGGATDARACSTRWRVRATGGRALPGSSRPRGRPARSHRRAEGASRRRRPDRWPRREGPRRSRWSGP